MRKTPEELEKIKQQYGVDELWSFSRLNKYVTSPYEYYLKYILKIKEDKSDGIYAVSGGTVHDIIERFYKKEISYEDMISEYEEALYLFEQAELKYNKTDEEKNAKIANKYEDCIKHFFKNHIPFTQQAMIEQFALTVVGDRVFQGYIDFVFKDEDGTFTILDWKTSTMYRGEKVLKEGKQLLLYAQALIQHGVPIEKIKICWDFIKYTTVTFKQKNGTIKERQIERNSIGSSLAATLKTKLKELKYTSEEIDSFIDLAVSTNSLSMLPEEIQKQFKFSDCLVYIPLTQEILDNLNSEIISTLESIDKTTKEWYNKKEQGVSERELDELWYDTEEQLKANEYYFLNLCGYSSKLHKPWGDYWAKKELENQHKDDIFFGLDADNQTNKTVTEEYAEDDLSWING